MFEEKEKYILYLFLIIVIFFILIENKKYTFPIYEKIQDDLPFVIFGITTLYQIYRKRKLNISSLLLDNKEFLLYSSFIFFITLYVLIKKNVVQNEYDNHKMKQAVKKAFISFIISYFSAIDLVFAPYFLVFIFSYYTHTEWV